mgnify:CR=1 FL=1
MIKQKLKAYIILFTIRFNAFFLICMWFLLICFLSSYTDILMYERNNISYMKECTTVEFDAETVESNNTAAIQNPDYEDLFKLANEPEVKSYEINYIDILLSTSMLDIDTNSNIGLFNIKGIDKSYFYDLRFGNIKLVEGRSFSIEEINNADNKIIISYIVAENNNLKIGDTIKLEVCNPSNAKENIIQEYILIGIFSPGRMMDDSKIQDLIHEFSDHNHNDENDTGIGVYKNDAERMNSLQNYLLIEDLNTIYMPNDAAKKLNTTIGEMYGNDYISSDYQGTYILQSENDVNSFKKAAEKILPNNFMIMSGEDAFELWMPNTVKAKNMLIIFSIIIGVALSVSIIGFINRDIFKHKNWIIVRTLMGFDRKAIEKKLRMKYGGLFVILGGVFVPAANALSSKYILPAFLKSDVSTGYYFNIQKLTRDIGESFIPTFHIIPNLMFLPIFVVIVILFYLVIKKTVSVSIQYSMGKI